MSLAIRPRRLPAPLSDVTDPRVVANVLKLYLETLPEPLLTHRLYDSVLAAATIRDEAETKPKIFTAANRPTLFRRFPVDRPAPSSPFERSSNASTRRRDVPFA